MLSKTKKLLFLTTGLAGALVVSSTVGVSLSSCTVEAVNGGNGSSSDGITLPDTWYNKDINWSDATSLNNLIIDKQGFVYSSKYKTEIIAILPGYESSTLVIPSTVTSITGYYNVTTNGTTTTKTAKGAFEGLTSITNVKFAGKNISQIGPRAFYGCTSLQAVNLPSSVDLIAQYAFADCSSLSTIDLSNIQYIGASAFAGAFTDVPYGSISLNLNKTTLISTAAFTGALGIGTVDFSKNTTLTQIAENAFSGCTSLSGDIDLSSATKLITIGSSSNPSGSGSSFANTAITNVYLPSTTGLRTIATNTFNNCKNLVVVGPKGTIGFTAVESLSGIYNKAFSGTKIATANISASTATDPLKAGAFSGMTELTTVNLSTVITTIPASCFMNCSSLESLTLPSSITSLSGGTSTFNQNSAGINITSGETTYPAFYGSGLTSIDLSNITSYQTTTSSRLSLPNTLFYNCANLTSVTLKAGTTSIGDGCFAGTTSLTSINTGENSSRSSDGYIATSDLTSIGQYAFWKSGISSVDISNISGTSYTQVKVYTFTSCPNLTTIKLPSTVNTIATYAVYSTPKLTSVNFGNLQLSSIANYNFSGCELTEIDLSHSTITSFTDSTPNIFNNLSKNTIVKLPSSTWNISSTSIFSYNENVTENGTTTSRTIPLNITFPNGFAPASTSTTGFSQGNLANHTMFSRISGDLDISSFAELRSVGRRTFFDGPVSSLTFNASTFANGKYGDQYEAVSSQYNYLGFLGTNTDTSPASFSYITQWLPFGNMNNLSSINFNKFTSNSTNEAASNVISKTTTSAWNEVVRIINSFASVENMNSETSTIDNLSTWNDEKGGLTAQVKIVESTTDVVESVSLKTISDNSELVKIDENLTSPTTFEYSGVTWTINVNNDNGTITITSSSNVDTYRLAKKLDSGTTYSEGKYVFFNTKSSMVGEVEKIIPNSNITVTLNVVSPTTTPSPSTK